MSPAESRALRVPSEIVEIRQLPGHDIALIGSIDRSEEIDIGYSVVDGDLIVRDGNWVIPTWAPDGTGEHTVAHQIALWRPVIDRGALLLGAFEDQELLGLVILEPQFEPGMAWLAFLHVSRPHRRRGAATALWDEAVRIARKTGASRMYVSATPSASAVGFYLSKGCELAVPPHPDLFALEPEDIHVIRRLVD